MTMTSSPVDNGVNSAALLDARNALSQAPEAAEFTWRSTTTWMNGTYSRSTVEGFSGLGQARGVVTDAPGMYLLGAIPLRTRRSSDIAGASHDTHALATHLHDYLASHTTHHNQKSSGGLHG